MCLLLSFCGISHSVSIAGRIFHGSAFFIFRIFGGVLQMMDRYIEALT